MYSLKASIYIYVYVFVLLKSLKLDLITSVWMRTGHMRYSAELTTDLRV